MRKKLKTYISFLLIFLIIFVMPFGIFNLLFPFRYRKLISKYASEYKLDRSLVASMVYVESKFNCKAVSKKGARGLMQIMPSTAISFYDNSQPFKVDNLYQPEVNISIGCNYLSYLFEKYFDETMVLACYNAGEAKVKQWAGDDKLSLNEIKYEETYNYVLKVKKIKKFYKYRFV